MLLVCSVVLLTYSIYNNAPPLVTGIFGVCVLVYAIVYTPWERLDTIYNDRRNRLASVWIVTSIGAFVVFGVLYACMLPREWYLSACGVALLSVAAYRGSCEIIYQYTGNGRVLNMMI